MAACTHLRIPVFMVVSILDTPTQLCRHGLHAVAYTQHRDAQLKYQLRRRGRLTPGHRFRPPRQDDAVRVENAQRLLVYIPGIDFAIHADLAHAARNQLCVLGAEIQYQDPVRVNIMLRHGSSALLW